MSYDPTRNLRFYPGASLSEERKHKVLNFEVDLDDVTVDDIVFNTARANTGTFYALVALIEETYGEEAARDLVREMGYRGGKRNIPAWLAANGVEKGSAELMSKYQDYAHAMRGPDHANAYSEWEDNICQVRRTTCAWHTGRPEGMESYCKYSSEGFLEAYRESDGALEQAKIEACMSFGDDHCHHVFTYRTDDAQDAPK